MAFAGIIFASVVFKNESRSALNFSRPAFPLKDSLKPKKAKMTSACTLVSQSSGVPKSAGRRRSATSSAGTACMIDFKQFEFWFVTGSQHLYGPKALEKVAANARQIAAALDAAPNIPATILFQPVIKSAEEATALCQRANTDANARG
jgi:hypothetical protein